MSVPCTRIRRPPRSPGLRARSQWMLRPFPSGPGRACAPLVVSPRVAVFAVMAALVGVGAALEAFALLGRRERPAPSAVRPTSGPRGSRSQHPLLDIAAHPAATATGSSRATAASSASATPGSSARPGTSPKAPVIGMAAARRQRLLADRHRRWRVHLRRRRARGSLGSCSSTRPSFRSRRHRPATATGSAADGGVSAFGRRVPRYATGVSQRPIVGMASTPSGHGYYLLASDGGVFAFGDAAFRGAAVDAIGPPATAIAASPDGAGYWVLRQNGIVHPFAVPAIGDIAGSQNPAVGIAARPNGGYWIAQGKQPPPPASGPSNLGQNAFLACTRAHESDRAGGYRAELEWYPPRAQFPLTWTTLRHGSSDLVGVDPARPLRPTRLPQPPPYQWQAVPCGARRASVALVRSMLRYPASRPVPVPCALIPRALRCADDVPGSGNR